MVTIVPLYSTFKFTRLLTSFCLVFCLISVGVQLANGDSTPDTSEVTEVTTFKSSSLDSTEEDGEFKTPLKLSFSRPKIETEEEEDEESGEEQCDGRLSSFVRNFDSAPYLPKDYSQIVESLPNIDVYDQVHHINDTLKIIERLVNYGQSLMGNTDLVDTVRYMSSIFMDKVYQARLSPQCSADLLNVINAIRNKEMWAFKFPDSFANTVPSGLLRGHISSFGEYDQCISIKGPQMDNKRHIYGKYCQVQFRSIFPTLKQYNSSFEDIFRSHPYYSQLMDISKKMNVDNYLNGKLVKKMIESVSAINYNIYHYGVCFPHTCSPRDIEKLYNSIFYPITKMPVKVEDRLCSTHKEITEVHLDNQQWTAVICLVVLAFIVTLSSLYSIYLNYLEGKTGTDSNSPLVNHDFNNNGNFNGEKISNSKLMELSSNLQHPNGHTVPVKRTLVQKFILAFSAIENSQKLFKVDNRFAALDTIRFILTVGVYSLQFFNFQAMFTMQMLRSLGSTVPGELLSSNAYWFARAPGFLIDGFVVNLGIMLIFSQFSRLKKTKGQFSYLIYLWKRWYRLSIAMVGTFFVIFLFPLIGDGPIWFINKQWLLPPCKNPKSILSSFLYYSNWNPMLGNYTIKSTFPICNPPTWFLSMSTQLYLFAPILFLPLYRWPRFGLSLTAFVILISPIFTASPRLFLGHPTYLEPTKAETFSDILRAFLNFHTNPVQYVTPLSIGMLTGYLIKCKPNMRVMGGRVVEIICWIASFGSIVLIYCWNNTFWDYNLVNNEYNAISWFIFSKLIGATSICYISYMCCTGQGGIVNKILSINFLQPVAKLSYAIYLLRMPTIFYRITSVRHTYEMHYYQTLQNIFIDYSITTVLAFFLYLLFEAPSNNIMRIFESLEPNEIFNKPQINDQVADKRNDVINNGKVTTVEMSKNNDTESGPEQNFPSCPQIA